ncbi:MAG: hypothetical protein GX751_00260 [Desulfuromonadaceae bacterium]|nr:hypothetical protein [Desulfuromonadaceae bacterium]
MGGDIRLFKQSRTTGPKHPDREVDSRVAENNRKVNQGLFCAGKQLGGWALLSIQIIRVIITIMDLLVKSGLPKTQQNNLKALTAYFIIRYIIL